MNEVLYICELQVVWSCSVEYQFFRVSELCEYVFEFYPSIVPSFNYLKDMNGLGTKLKLTSERLGTVVASFFSVSDVLVRVQNSLLLL